jgi:SAM-dependent methyltransferase
MAQTLSDLVLAAFPANQVLLPEHTDTRPAEVSGKANVEYDDTNVETRPTPEMLADPSRSGYLGDFELSRPEAQNTFIEAVEVSRGEQPTLDVLHVGCGIFDAEKLPPIFRHAGWREIRLDIDPDVKPDVIASITDMQMIPEATADAVYSSHNVEHLYPHDVPLALREMNRVLRPSGFAFIKVPDLQEVARFVAEGKLEDPLYVSSVGVIAPLDILFGHRPALARGNTFMAHHTGFTATTLGTALIGAGFVAVIIQRDLPNFSLTGIAFRTQPDAEQMAIWRARLLPAADRPTVLYTRNA